MKLIYKGILFLVLAVASTTASYAQRTLADVSIEPEAILIGEQTVLHITVTTGRERSVQWLLPADTLMRGVEILAFSPQDTSVIDNNRLLIKQDVLITSFDPSLYLLPPVRVADGADTVYSNQVALKVSTVPVDTEHPENFADIKDVWKPPLVLADYYPYIFGVLLFCLLVCIIGYTMQHLRNRKSLIPKKETPKLPPHIQAVKELDGIKQQKLWQQGLNKEYYTLVTDALRRYITDRFGMNAMEMTSVEILDHIKATQDAESVYRNLQQILQLSDFVKFAKMLPLPDENDLSMTNAYLFVNQTKKEETVKPEETLKENE
ncbi:hypothetical protein Barb4_01356 [Bacteroidales bacterium Barb4]|nr:hypothetical protein Barb4_01356 [Bacteroidales bacterium Barb4]